MLGSSKKHHTLGVVRNSRRIRIAQLSFQKGKPYIEHLSEIPVTHTQGVEHVKPLYMVGDTPLSHLTNDIFTSTALSTMEVLVRPIEIALVKERDVNAVFHFQAEPLLPYPPEEAIINKIKLSKNENSTLLTLIAVRKLHLEKHIDEWKLCDIEPEVVSCVPAALATFSTYCTSTENPYIVLHLGEDHISCLLVQKGKLMASYALQEGMCTLEKALVADLRIDSTEAEEALSHVDFTSIDNAASPQLALQLEQIRLGIARITYALSKQAKEEISQILVTGPGSSLPHLYQLLTQGLPKEVVLAESAAFNLNQTELNHYAIPIGLALGLNEQGDQQMDFRKEELVYPQPWKRIKKPLMICATLSLLCLIRPFHHIVAEVFNLDE